MPQPAKPKPKRKPAPGQHGKGRRQGPKIQPELLEPWERQAGESGEAWEAWQIYRDMETPRSLRKVARSLNKSLTAISNHSVRWQWVTRAQVWDVEQDRVRTRSMLDEQAALGKRHAAQMQGHLQALSAPMQEILKRINDKKLDLSQLDPEQLLRVEAMMARAAPRVATAERLARGMNTEGPPAADPAGEMRRKSDSEIADYLLGVDDGRAIAATQKEPAS